MNIKHRKKWRRAPWDPNIMIPYMSYYLCESYRDVNGAHASLKMTPLR